MQNIQITQSKHKRSVESLIQDSAIDNDPSTINFEILELKKAYNQTYKSFNTKIQNLQNELSTYKEKCKKLQEANVSLAQKCYQFEKKKEQYGQMKVMCQKMKRKVLYIESKYEKLMQNRSLVQQGYDEANKQEQKQSYEKFGGVNSDSLNYEKYKLDKNEVYKQIADLISQKVKIFTKEIRVHSMTKELENKIQSFLAQLIYITPISRIGAIRVQEIEQNLGSKKGPKQQENILLTDQRGWKEISRKIDHSNQRSITPIKRQNLFNQELSKKSAFRTRSPLNAYNQDYQQSRNIQYRPSPRKVKIFTNQ